MFSETELSVSLWEMSGMNEIQVLGFRFCFQYILCTVVQFKVEANDVVPTLLNFFKLSSVGISTSGRTPLLTTCQKRKLCNNFHIL